MTVNIIKFTPLVRLEDFAKLIQRHPPEVIIIGEKI